jgi:hypothetical protein
MRFPQWLTENRLLAAIQIALSLGGAGLIVWLVNKWLSLPNVPLVAVALIAGALILYGTLHLPQPKPRRRYRAGALPPVALPGFLTARGQINALVTEGQNIRRYLPAQPDANDLAAALVGGMLSHQHLWRVAGWHARAWQAVQRLAPASTALYDNAAIPASNYDAMREYLDARLGELREIMRPLP